MEQKTLCLILRKIPFREKSLIVNTFTWECGRIDLMLRGERTVSAKKFPSSGLFRLFNLEFVQKEHHRNSSDIYTPKVMEYAGAFDEISLHTGNYLLVCEYAAFLLKHTAPFLVLPETFDSLLILLQRAVAKENCTFEVTASKLVFLEESGLLPEETGGNTANKVLLREIMEYALDREKEKPCMLPAYEKRLTEWVKALCRYHNLF
ncbi:MAG: recombination protein O N-terminal domain-containing protein [Lentisphaeria bacterium]|nr:recombination protein O N-terminal domain-containing protein [Lentisphaeria bacterium]